MIFPRMSLHCKLVPVQYRENDINLFLMIFPRMSLHCMLVLVQHREYQYGLFQVMRPFNRKNRNPPRLSELRTPFVTSFNPAFPKISSVVNKYTTPLQATANCKKAFPNTPIIAYRRNASLRDLLVHSTL